MQKGYNNGENGSPAKINNTIRISCMVLQELSRFFFPQTLHVPTALIRHALPRAFDMI